eukprot:1424590-Prymnesium_polylepis.1
MRAAIPARSACPFETARAERARASPSASAVRQSRRARARSGSAPLCAHAEDSDAAGVGQAAERARATQHTSKREHAPRKLAAQLCCLATGHINRGLDILCVLGG